MSRFNVLFALCALASLSSAQAPAPAAQSVSLQVAQVGNPSKFCMAGFSNDNGAPATVVPCGSTLPSQYSWSVLKGGAASGTGPATQIRLWGNKCLDVTGGVNADGTKLQIWDCDASASNKNQLFTVNGDNTIHWAGTNKCVDLTNGNFASEQQLQIWTCVAGNSNQQFVPVRQAPISGVHVLYEEGAGCLAANSSNNGAAVTIQDCGLSSSAATVQWALPASGEGPITAFNGAKCLDVTNGVLASGTKLQVWDCVQGNTNQHFVASRASGGIQTIQVGNTGFCVDLTGGSTVPGNPVQIWSCVPGSSNQQWRFSPDF